jgi:hypothetical protein
MTCGHFLDYRPEIPVFLLETIVIFAEEPLEIIKKYPVKNSVFRMPLTIDPCHSRDNHKVPCGFHLCSIFPTPPQSEGGISFPFPRSVCQETLGCHYRKCLFEGVAFLRG